MSVGLGQFVLLVPIMPQVWAIVKRRTRDERPALALPDEAGVAMSGALT